MRKPRWLTEKLIYNNDHEILQHVTVYALGENKELVKSENRHRHHKRKLLLIDEK